MLVKYLPKNAWSKMCYNLFKPHVSYREAGALINVTFEVAGPGPIGLVGPSGSGKSTFMKLLSGEKQIINGTLEVTPKLDRPVIYIDKMFPIQLSSKVIETLKDALGNDLKETDALDRIMQWTGICNEKDTIVRELSGGAKYRYKLALGLAQAACKSLDCPPILLVDELLDREDVRIRTPVNHLLRSLAEDLGITIVLASHDMIDIRIACNQVITFWNGKIESVGPPNKSKYVLSKVDDEVHSTLKNKYGVENPYKFNFNPEQPPGIKPKKDKGLRFIHLPSYQSSFSPPDESVPFL